MTKRVVHTSDRSVGPVSLFKKSYMIGSDGALDPEPSDLEAEAIVKTWPWFKIADPTALQASVPKLPRFTSFDDELENKAKNAKTPADLVSALKDAKAGVDEGFKTPEVPDAPRDELKALRQGEALSAEERAMAAAMGEALADDQPPAPEPAPAPAASPEPEVVLPPGAVNLSAHTAESLNALGITELREVARQFGVPANIKKSEMTEQILGVIRDVNS